ncbi:MAG: hypothetical protein QNJ31_05850 [Candidatus Caenarcaniphilales bacterium]|nr:hypothetical protein [Candidatus Caenarcaniphilales bacterium]
MSWFSGIPILGGLFGGSNTNQNVKSTAEKKVKLADSSNPYNIKSRRLTFGNRTSIGFNKDTKGIVELINVSNDHEASIEALMASAVAANLSPEIIKTYTEIRNILQQNRSTPLRSYAQEFQKWQYLSKSIQYKFLA